MIKYLFLARQPSEADPAVTAQDLPRPIKEGEEVLARWSDDGWYYRGKYLICLICQILYCSRLLIGRKRTCNGFAILIYKYF